MRRTREIVALSFLAVLTVSLSVVVKRSLASDQNELRVPRGTRMPDATVMIEGKRESLFQYLESVSPNATSRYFVFWNDSCAPCKTLLRVMARDSLIQKAPLGTVVAVHMGKESELSRRFLETEPLPFLVAYDTESALAEAWDVSSVPTTVRLYEQDLIGARSGLDVYLLLGMRETFAEKLDEAE